MDLDEAIANGSISTRLLIYRDAEDNTTNVIYRREDGTSVCGEVKNRDQKERFETSKFWYRGIRSIYALIFIKK